MQTKKEDQPAKQYTQLNGFTSNWSTFLGMCSTSIKENAKQAQEIIIKGIIDYLIKLVTLSHSLFNSVSTSAIARNT